MSMRNALYLLMTASFSLILLASCGGGLTSGIAEETNPVAVQNDGTATGNNDQDSAWPVALPQDVVQPWEAADNTGIVEPNRGTMSLNTTTEFTPGVERYSEGGSVINLGEASQLNSSAGAIAYAMYRVVLGGDQPGVISVDANLHEAQDDYWVAVSDYAAGAWRWQGPFTEASIRLSLEEGDYLSGVGNTFVCVLTYDGAGCDVVGVGVNTRNSGDITPPPIPSALAATPVRGGLKLEWTSSTAGDLAGYRVYWSYSPIPESLAGSQVVEYLTGLTSAFLPVSQTRVVYVRVAAVDVSGNQSALSPQASALPLGGVMPGVLLTTDEVSGPFGLDAQLTASGADTYDWDINGDGIYEITGDASGVQNVSFTQAGVLRPSVIGNVNGGVSQARGAVSLVVSANERPEAACWASPASGVIPLNVTFTGAGVDSDGTIVEYSWDFDGDKTYDWTSPDNANPPAQMFVDHGLYNAVLRVEDNSGAWATDQVAVLASVNLPPVLRVEVTPRNIMGTGNLTQSAEISFLGSYDPEGTDLTYYYKRPGQTYWDDLTPGEYIDSFALAQAGAFEVQARAVDGDGAASYMNVPINVYTFGSNDVYYPSVDYGQYTDITVDQGHIAVTFFDASTNQLISCSGDALNPGDFTNFDSIANLGADPHYEMNRNTYHEPSLVYYVSSTGDLAYAEATDVNCTSWYSPDVLVTAGDVGKYCTIALDNYYQCIAYFNDSDNKIYYLEATNAFATTWTTPVEVTSSSSEYRDLSLAIINGYPAIAYYRVFDTALYYTRATASDGSAWAAPIEVDTNAGDLGRYVKLLEIENRPAVAYFDLTTGDEAVYYLRADDTTGSSWTAANRVEVVTCGASAGPLDMAIIDGYPAVVAYRGYSTPWFGVCAATDGMGFWKDGFPESNVSGTTRGQYCSLADYYGLPAMVYFDTAEAELRFTRGIVP